MKLLASAAMALLVVLHHDIWAWHDARRLLGLPIGLSYHVLSSLAASLVLAWLVRVAWPDEGDEEAR